ncbi:MAG: ACT domain-containing protein, partial [Bdellovibrionota bacterium]
QPAGLEAVQNLEIRHSASEQNLQTVVEIMASDSRGLLYRIARAFAALGIKVARADIRTEGSRARDTFFVVDRQGRAPDLSGDVGHLRKEIEA